MKNLSLITGLAIAMFVPLLGACSSEGGTDPEVAQGAEEALGGSGNYCPSPYTGGHSSSPRYMYSGAHAAMLAAGVGDSALIQTFGDAPASVGTHCPEPGVSYSDATDIDPGGSPCGRVHALRMQGFAAFYRVPPSFGYHIHAVYAGAPVMKSSLRGQLNSFYAGRNGLVSNAIETNCRITQSEIDAVRAVANGGGGGGGGGGCVPGGHYCGGDKVSGNADTLYRCNGGSAPTVVEHCASGCSVRAGQDDTCNSGGVSGGGCVVGGTYCGGDKVGGDASTLYRCNGATASAVQHCASGCVVRSGQNDVCR